MSDSDDVVSLFRKYGLYIFAACVAAFMAILFKFLKSLG